MTDKTDAPLPADEQMPTHRVCFREILAWANEVRARRHPTSHPVPTGEEVKELMDAVTAAVNQDRATQSGALAALKAENERLREALTRIAEETDELADRDIARAALSPQEEGA